MSGKKKHALGQKSLLSFFGGGEDAPASGPSPVTAAKSDRKRWPARVACNTAEEDDTDALLMAVEHAEKVHLNLEPTPPPKRCKIESPLDMNQFASSAGRASSPMTPEDIRPKICTPQSQLDDDDDDDEEMIVRRKHPAANKTLHLASPPVTQTPFDTPAPEQDRKNVRDRLLLSFDMTEIESPEADPTGEAKWSQKNDWSTDVRDSQKRRPGQKGYDPTTLYIPSTAMDKLTPFQRQFWEIKSTNYNTVLLFKKGKFYECYDRDADIGAKELHLNYTGGGRVDMRCVGVPESAFSRHAARLVQLGYRVGRVDQVETALAMEARKKQGAKAGPSICKRALVKILTKATLIDEELLPDFQSRYLLAIREIAVVTDIAHSHDVVVGVCLVDAAVGSVTVGQFEDDIQRTKLETLLARTRPKEVLVECDFENTVMLSERTKLLLKSCCALDADIIPRKQGSDFPPEFNISSYFEADRVPRALSDFYTALSSTTENPAVSALGAVAVYLNCLKIDIEIISLGNFAVYHHGNDNTLPETGSSFTLVDQTQSGCLVLDGTTLDNLEILINTTDGSEMGTLINFIDRSSSAMGKRLLRKWLCKPLLDPRLINDRLNAIELLFALDSPIFEELRRKLRKVPDLERGLTRLHAEATVVVEAVHFDDTNKRQVKSFVKILRGLEHSLQLLQWLEGELKATETEKESRRLLWLVGTGSAVPAGATEQLDYFLTTAFELERAEESGELVPLPGCDEFLDRAGESKASIEAEMESLLVEAKQLIGANNLKFRHQGKEPYQIEVPVAKKSKVPLSWSLKSQSKTCVRYWSPEIADLIKDFKEADEALDAAQSSFMKRLLEKFDQSFGTWSAIARSVSEIDVMVSLAIVSFLDIDSMCRPTFVDESEPVFDARALRHPSLALKMGPNFVPNDVYLGPKTDDRKSAGSTVVVTGPNMGGKSTILRQTCIATILAQVGCYVPASSCSLTPVDRIYTRIGAQDRISRGQSTFLVEMDETAGILRGATKRSLVVLDELGRGTSTFDGFSIAWAVLRELNERIQCRCLFSTHYHMLTEYASAQSGTDSRLALFCMSAVVDTERKDITFLYKFEPGVAEESRGIYCARLAGIGENITSRAIELAESLRMSLEARLQSNRNTKLLRLFDAAVDASQLTELL